MADAGPFTDTVAWSRELDTYIRVVEFDYTDADNWTFRKCKEDGTSTTIAVSKGYMPISYFQWEEIED